MSTKKALLHALGVTAVSCILLTIVRGIPTSSQLWGGAAIMFATAFVVMKFLSNESTGKPNGKGT